MKPLKTLLLAVLVFSTIACVYQVSSYVTTAIAPFLCFGIPTKVGSVIDVSVSPAISQHELDQYWRDQHISAAKLAEIRKKNPNFLKHTKLRY